jgi:hypothetical protein
MLATAYTCATCNIYLIEDVNSLRLEVCQYINGTFQCDTVDSNIYNRLLVRCNLLFDDYQYNLERAVAINIYKKALIDFNKNRRFYLRCFIFVLFASAALTIYFSICLIKVTSIASILAWILSWWATCRDIMKTNAHIDNPSNDPLHYTLGRAIWIDVALTLIFFTLTVVALHTLIDLILLLTYLTCQAASFTFMYKLRPEF